MMQGELVKLEEQSIARYIEGLRYDIANMLQLQTYLSMNDVCKLALKIDKQLKEAKGNRYMGLKMVTQEVGILDLTYKVKLLKLMIRKTHRVEVSKLLVHLLLVADDALNAKD